MSAIEFDEDNIPPPQPDLIKPSSQFSGKELKELLDSSPEAGDTRDWRESNPRHFQPGRLKRSKNVLGKRGRPPREKEKSAVERVLVVREDPDMMALLESDPIKFIQSEFSRALIAEALINRELYAHDQVDPMALTASNKRMVELADAMKTLPKQNEGARGKNQKSAAELIEDAMSAHDTTTIDSLTNGVESKALERAAGAFDEDE